MQQERAMAATLEQEASPHLRVLDTAVVLPSPEPQATSLPLTFFDVVWLNFPPVERVFFYRLNPDADIAALLANLKDSFSHALGAFYPLTGRLRLVPGTNERHELHRQPGDGVTFTVAELDADVEELAADEPTEVVRILPLVPALSSTQGAVLALQATVLRGGSGLAVGMAVHHAACDGSSSTRFLHTWAAAGNGAGAPPPPPLIDRTLVKDPSGLYDVVTATKPKKGFAKTADDQLFATFKLSKEIIQGVKDAVASASAGQAGAGEAPPPRCSSLVATFSLIWSCYQRAKGDASGGGGGGETYFMFPVDQRSRMKPDPIPDEYFGNCIRSAIQGAPSDQLAQVGAGALLAACTALAAAIEQAVSEDGSVEKMVLRRGRIGEALVSGRGVLAVAGSPRFRVYDVDFGFGRPAKVEMVSVARTGAMAVADSRGGTGGMEVGISLPPAGMRRFQGCFHDAITWLHQH